MSAPVKDGAGQRWLFSVAAALLDQGRVLDGVSRPLTVVALALLLVLPGMAVPPSAALIVVVALVALAGCAEAYFALRVAFDAALFRCLAESPARQDLAELDHALGTLGLVPTAKRGRPATERVAGARRLLTRQATMLLLQILLVLAGAVLALRGG